MSKTYLFALRRELITNLLASENVRVLAAKSGFRDPALYRYNRQTFIDEGERPRLKTVIVIELADARRRIKERETELSETRLALAVPTGFEPVYPP